MAPMTPDATNIDYLTSALRRAGVLNEGCVRTVEPEDPRDTILSHIVRLQLRSDGAADAPPASLVLKTARSDRMDPSWVAGRQEVAFDRYARSSGPATRALRQLRRHSSASIAQCATG